MSDQSDNNGQHPPEPPDDHRFSDLVRNLFQVSRSPIDPVLDPTVMPSSSSSVDLVYQVWRVADAADESGPPPASSAAIESLLETTASVDTTKEDCVVCREGFMQGQKVKELPCQHLFHTDCIVLWLEIRNTCPVCRYELPTDNELYDEQRQDIRRAERDLDARQLQGEYPAHSGDDLSSPDEELYMIEGDDMHDMFGIQRDDMVFGDITPGEEEEEEEELDDDEDLADMFRIISHGDDESRDSDDLSNPSFLPDQVDNAEPYDKRGEDDDHADYGSVVVLRSRLLSAENLNVHLQEQLEAARASALAESLRSARVTADFRLMLGDFRHVDVPLTILQLRQLETRQLRALRSTRSFLEQALRSAPPQCQKCNCRVVDVIISPCNCICCCRQCMSNGITDCPSCGETVGSFESVRFPCCTSPRTDQ